jgi:hypothetical protein
MAPVAPRFDCHGKRAKLMDDGLPYAHRNSSLGSTYRLSGLFSLGDRVIEANDLICSYHLFILLFPYRSPILRRGLAVFVRLVPIAILVWAIAGVAFGLIVDLPVFFRVCVLSAVAALPLVLLILWLDFASQKRRA